MRAVVVQALPERRLVVVEDVPEVVPGEGEVVVRVRAASLNRGEVVTALADGPEGLRPGADLAGTVEAAASGSGFQVGDRVAGLVGVGAWAERVAVPPVQLVHLPDGIGFPAAAALPVAGLTAALALTKGGDLAGRRVLVTGATGGVGTLALQLAARAGAHVTAHVRDDRHRELLRRLGAEVVAVGTADAAAGAPYDLVLESVGGALLAEALGWLGSGGTCVLVGNAGGARTTFDADRFRMRPGAVYGGTTLYGFFLGEELSRTPPAEPLAALVRQTAAGELDPVVGVTTSWRNVQDVATDLLARRFIGKAILTL